MAHLSATNGTQMLLRAFRRPQMLQCAFKSNTTTTTTTSKIDDLDLDAITADAAAATASTADVGAHLHDDDYEQRERNIERSRNKSRLLPQHRNMLNELRPYDEPQSWIHNTVKYNRMQFGRLGLASGVDPRLCFATAAERATRDAYERVAHPHTLQQMIAQSRAERDAERRAVGEREEQIAKKLAKLDQWVGELNAKVAKREADAQAARDRKDRLVEEVRRQFGFKMDARDDRFKDLLAAKEKEDKKRQKEEKRKQKDDRMLAKLQEQIATPEAKKPEVAAKKPEAETVAKEV